MRGAAAVVRALAALALGAPGARAFLGVADTSFVTVVANPAEAANWASQLQRLGAQLAAAQATLQTVEQLRAYVGDPRAAAAAMPDLAELARAIGALEQGGQTAEDLLQAWQAQGGAQRLLGEAALLQAAGAGSSMSVFGSLQPRDASLYAGLAGDADATAALRAQISGEQAARQSLAAELSLAWGRFRAAATESAKQAALAEISQLQSQDQLMEGRRRALVDDLALSDRQGRDAADARSRAADEQLLAQSALLNQAEGARARDAEAGRMATLAKAAAAPAAAADYSGLRLWTTADASGGSP